MTITSGTDIKPLIFIDHVAYGKPLEPPGKPDKICENYYAKIKIMTLKCSQWSVGDRNYQPSSEI